MEFVRPALQDYGDTEVVTAFLERLAARGGGAERQRASASRHVGSRQWSTSLSLGRRLPRTTNKQPITA